MLTVEEIIGDLLLRHNCVIVPAFGGFVTQRVGAQLDTSNGTMTPPRKAILFNRQLINNDGLLITSYASQNHADYDQAQDAVAMAVSRWENDLKNGARISIDRVGFLYLDNEHNLCFEQDRFYNLLMESYGLGQIQFVPVRKAVVQMPEVAMPEQRKTISATPVVEFEPAGVILTEHSEEVPVISLDTARRAVRPWRYAVAAALLPVAFYSFWIPMKTDVLESGILTLNDFNPFRKAAPAQYHPETASYEAPSETQQPGQLETIPDGVSIFSFSLDDDRYIPVRVREGQTTASSGEVTKPAPSNHVEEVTMRSFASHIIVGCFSDMSNAQNLVRSLKTKGFDASVLNGRSNGLIRVSAGNGADFHTLQPKLKAEGLEGWVLK